MKKIMALLLAVIMLISMTACGGNSGSDIAGVDDLEGKTIGVQQGTTGAIFAEDEYGADAVKAYSKGADAVIALQQDKVDAVIIDNEPAKVFVSENDDIKILDEPFVEEDYAICIAKENSDLTAAFNQAIAELKSNGTLDALLDYYINGAEGAEAYESPADADYSNGTLTMATNAAFPPYEYWEGEEIKGFDVDFARAICDILGYELVVEDMEFDSIILSVQSGKTDFGAAGMTVTEDRLENIDFTDSYYTSNQAIIVKK